MTLLKNAKQNLQKVEFLFYFLTLEYILLIFAFPIGKILIFCTIPLAFIIMKKMEKWYKITLFFIFIITLQSLAKNDFSSLLFAVSNLLTIISFHVLFSRLAIGFDKLVYKYLFCVVLPLTFFLLIFNINIDIPEEFKNEVFTFKSRFIPNSQNNFNINIGPQNFTKHFTGDMGVVTFFISWFYYLWERKKYFLYLLLVGLFLVIFSGSRTAFFLIIAGSTILFINLKRIHVAATIVVLISMLFVFYSIDTIFAQIEFFKQMSSNNEYISQNLKIDNASGISSGRSFLWEYHLSLFKDHYLLGVHSSLLQFKIGDLLYNGELATAGSESFYTNCLARYGLLGFVFILLPLLFLKSAFSSKNLFKIVFIAIFILSNVLNSTYQNVFGAISPLMYCLLFAHPTYQISKKTFIETRKLNKAQCIENQNMLVQKAL